MGQDDGGPRASGSALVERLLLRTAREGWSRGGRPLVLLGLGLAVLAAPVVFRAAAVSAPSLRAALETMMTLFAFAAAWLLRAQFASSRRLRDLLLLDGILALGLLSLGTAAVPAALDLRPAAYFAVAELWGGLFVAALFTAAAFAPADWLVAPRRYPIAITAASVLAVAGGVLLGVQSSAHDLAGGVGNQRALVPVGGHPLVLVLVVSATVLFAYAAIGFACRHKAESDRLAQMLAIATVLMAGASVPRVLRYSLVPGRIDPALGLRVMAFALILAAAAIRERQLHARTAKASALAERRRVARDLHDGIAQDLAFIAAHGSRMAETLGDDHPVVVAARRALALSRSTISDLSDPAGATARESLEAVAEELRHRFGIAIAIDAQLGSDLDAGAREHVTRIAREAIANAARHGRARNVIVSLRQTDTGVALRVIDDGRGILGATSVAAPEGFGLRSMRERAAALGGQLSIRQAGAGGTELEVVLP
jgi:signal transduction histidine kinase